VSSTTAPEPNQPSGATALEQHLQRALERTEQQLSDAQQRIADLEALLEALPDIFERKFAQRLQPVLERQERLLQDNSELCSHLQQLGSSQSGWPPRLTAKAGGNNNKEPPEAELPVRRWLRRVERHDQPPNSNAA
jgi:TolA-binding protein